MGKHFGLGKCLDCDNCGTAFYQDPVDQNETCRDCIDDKPIPRCEDCDGLMKRDRRGSKCEECEDKHFDKLMKEKARDQQRERIKREGFEVMAWEAQDGQGCEYSKTFQISPRKKETRHCGKEVLVVLDLRGPQYPDGMKVALCRECLAEHVRDLMRYLT